jgi:hypothetical protein
MIPDAGTAVQDPQPLLDEGGNSCIHTPGINGMPYISCMIKYLGIEDLLRLGA